MKEEQPGTTFFHLLRAPTDAKERKSEEGRLAKSPRNFSLRLLACTLIDRHDFPHDPVNQLRRIYVSLKN